MKKSIWNIARLSGLLAIGMATFAGAAVLPVSNAGAAEYRIQVTFEAERLVPGVLSYMGVKCDVFTEQDLQGDAVSIIEFRNTGNESINPSSSRHQNSYTFTLNSPAFYRSYKCKLYAIQSGTGQSEDPTPEADEPFKAHPGSVVSVSGNF